MKNKNDMKIKPTRLRSGYGKINKRKVGATRFELATSRPPAERATKLRHTPTF